MNDNQLWFDHDLDSITITWSVEDVLDIAEGMDAELEVAEARDILALLKRNHDATIGINNNVIADTIEFYLSNPDQFSKKG
jgi:hypothetical protein